MGTIDFTYQVFCETLTGEVHGAAAVMTEGSLAPVQAAQVNKWVGG